MAIRFEQGKARPQPPRLKDLPTVLTVGEPSRSHGPDGRFTPRNVAACDRGVKALVRRHLGRDTTGPEAEAVYREVRTLYGAFMRSLPNDDAVIQDLVARQARSSAFSARLAARAIELGLETEEGRKALDMSIKLDARAERLAVTAWDLAQKLGDRPMETEAWNEMARLARLPRKRDD
jgi:hypothetical protein